MNKIKVFLYLLVLTCLLSACASSDYREANSLFESGNYDEALKIFQELGDYKDSVEFSKECQYQIAKELLALGHYDEANQLFLNLDQYADSASLCKECIYQKILLFIEQQNYEAASAELDSISGYKDSDELTLLVSNWLAYQDAQDLIQKKKYADAFSLLNQLQGFHDVDILLSRFTEKKLLVSESYTIFDNLGNRRKARIEYEYNSNGQLVSADGSKSNRLAHFSRQIQAFANDPYSISNAAKEYYEYNDDGTIHTILGTAGSNKAYFIEFNYDENGKIEYEDATTNTDEGKCYYIYNDKEQLVGVQLDRNSSPIMRYSYDNAGNIIKAESTAFGKMFTMKYNYEDNTLISRDVSILGSEFLTEHYTYSDDGTLELVKYEYSDSRNGRIEIKYNYKDYVFYKEDK